MQELQKNHDIIKLTTTSLVHCHHLASSVVESGNLHEETLVEGRYTHNECVNIHLRFLAFVLQEGMQYLVWHRARDIWECLVVNPNACEFDKEVQYNRGFIVICLSDTCRSLSDKMKATVLTCIISFMLHVIVFVCVRKS